MRPAGQVETPDAEKIREHLKVLLESGEFAQSHRMKRFLSFIVAETLAGRAEALKEYTIATSAFDRPASFDPTIDPVVRVEARRLRAKLAAYYREHVDASGIMISLPKGCYVPTFRPAACVDAPDKNAGSLGVSRFSPLSAEAEPWCAALQFELIDQLARVHNLRVAVCQGPVLSGDPVATVLTGCIRLHNDQVRVVAHVISSRTGECHWSTALVAPITDGLQEELARDLAWSVAEHLKLR